MILELLGRSLLERSGHRREATRRLHKLRLLVQGQFRVARLEQALVGARLLQEPVVQVRLVLDLCIALNQLGDLLARRLEAPFGLVGERRHQFRTNDLS